MSTTIVAVRSPGVKQLLYVPAAGLYRPTALASNFWLWMPRDVIVRSTITDRDFDPFWQAAEA